MRLIDADALHETIDMFVWPSRDISDQAHNIVSSMPSFNAESTLYGYDIADLAFIAALIQKERISPTELRAILYDTERMSRIVIADITNQARQEIERQMRINMPMRDS